MDSKDLIIEELVWELSERILDKLPGAIHRRWLDRRSWQQIRCSDIEDA